MNYLGLIIVAMALLVSGCEKPKVVVTSVSFVDDMDRGSGNFDRMINICFREPLTADYYHDLTIVSKEGVKIKGGTPLKPLASNPDEKCHLRNLYNYINKDSPPGARQMIKDYMVPGNIHQVLIQIYFEKPVGKEIPISEKLYSDL